MTPFTTHASWFSLSQRKKARPAPADTARYRKRKDMVSAPQPSSLPLLFAADSISNARSKNGALSDLPLQAAYMTPSQTPEAHLPPVKSGKGYDFIGRRRKPVLATDDAEWTLPQSPFVPRPCSRVGTSPVSTPYCHLPTPPSHRSSPPPRFSPDSTAESGSTRSSQSQNTPVPPRPQRRIVSAGAARDVPPSSGLSALGPRPISAFPTSSRPSASMLGQRPVSLPADTSDIYNFFLGNNVTRKRAVFHEISPRDMRDLASDQKGNKRSFIGLGPGDSEQPRKSVKPRVAPFPSLAGSPCSVDKVWFASSVTGNKCS